MPWDAMWAGVSGVVTISVLGWHVEPARATARLLAQSPVWSASAAVLAVLGLATVAAGEARALGRGGGRRRVGLWAMAGGAAAALAGSAVLGPVSLTLGASAVVLVMLHQAVGRFVPAVGAVLAVVLVGVVLTLANPPMTYAWPVLLAMAHVGACRIVGRGLGTRRPRMSVRGAAGVLVSLAVWSLTVVAVQGARAREIAPLAEAASLRGAAWIGPAVAGAAMAVSVAMYAARLGGRGTAPAPRRVARAADRLEWRGLLFYDAGWLASVAWPLAAVPLVLLLASALRRCGAAKGGRTRRTRMAPPRGRKNLTLY